MQNKGLIYINKVNPDDIGLFNSLSTLYNKQMDLLSSETSMQVDGSSIMILGGKDGEADGDYIGTSVLAIITIDSDSIHAGAMTNLYNDIAGYDSDNLTVSQPTENQLMITVRPGSVLNPEDIERISKLIKQTTVSFEIKDMVDSMLVNIEVSESIMPNSTNVAFHNTPKSIEGPSTTQTNDDPVSDAVIDKIVARVTEEVLRRLNENGSELKAIITDLENSSTRLENRLVENVIQRVTLYKSENTKNVEPESNGISGMESLTSSIIDDIAEVKESIIYDTKIKISDLVQGCENDEVFFNKVMENKDKIDRDELVNVAHFNMFEYLTVGSQINQTPREKIMREIKLGLR